MTPSSSRTTISRRRAELLRRSKRARASVGHLRSIEIEVENLDQLREALKHSPDAVLLDNMSIAMLKEAVAIVGGQSQDRGFRRGKARNGPGDRRNGSRLHFGRRAHPLGGQPGCRAGFRDLEGPSVRSGRSRDDGRDGRAVGRDLDQGGGGQVVGVWVRIGLRLDRDESRIGSLAAALFCSWAARAMRRRVPFLRWSSGSGRRRASRSRRSRPCRPSSTGSHSRCDSASPCW